MKEETNKYKQIIVTPFSWSSKWFECQRFVTTPQATSQLYLLVKHMIQKSSYYECQQQSQTAYPMNILIIFSRVFSIKPVIQSLNPWYMIITTRDLWSQKCGIQQMCNLAQFWLRQSNTTQVDENRRNKKGEIVPKVRSVGIRNLGTWFPMFFFLSDLPWNLSCRISIKHVNFMNHQEMGFGKTSSICEVNMP